MRPPIVPILSWLLMLSGVCGCGLPEDAKADDEGHHLEHVVPEHKPASYAEAIEQIRHRAEHLNAHAGHGHDDEAREVRELLEIINWIPELAADSDLSEASWNKAAAAAAELSSRVAARSAPDGSPSPAGLWEVVAPALQVLEPLVPEAGLPAPAIRHHHDHEHHDHEHHDHEHHDRNEQGRTQSQLVP